MKTLKLILLSLLFVSLSSCDKKDQIDQATTNSLTKVEKFLNTYYSDAYSLGRSIHIDNHEMNISEVLGTKQRTPIGYIATNNDSSKLLYFVDINTENNSLTSIDFGADEKDTFILDDFIANQNIKNIDDFNFLDLIEGMGSSVTGKRRFWGWECGPASTGFPQNFRTCCHYVFWIQNGCKVVYAQ